MPRTRFRPSRSLSVPAVAAVGLLLLCAGPAPANGLRGPGSAAPPTAAESARMAGVGTASGAHVPSDAVHGGPPVAQSLADRSPSSTTGSPGRSATPANGVLGGSAPPTTGALASRRPGGIALPQLWRWPLLPAPRVLRAFDPPDEPWLAGHRGVDLAAVPGQPVLSAATGVVVFAGPLAGRSVVSVEHGGIHSSYEPVIPLVKPGDTVVVGQPVAVVAPLPLHCRTRPCLHWGAFESLSVPRRYLDPRSLVGAGPVRLVPPDGGSH